jgi:two-component system chemotaxis response regulator CheB
MPPDCVVIGASAGGLEPLREVVSQLPPDFATPVFVVVHIPSYVPSLLPGILSHAGSLPATHPEDHARIEEGHIYVAPPDHHLLINDSHIAVKRGPKENGFRPSIDALFRSAAYTYGPGVVGIVLSGDLSDGTSGLWSIKRLGGVAIVQEPAASLYPSMPRSALEYVEADYRGTPAEIGETLVELSRLPVQPASTHSSDDPDVRRMALETQIAAGTELPEQSILDLGELSPFTCPECHGVLVRIMEGKSFRFRCHTGHGFSADALLESLTGTVREFIWQATRGYQEGSMLLVHIAQHLRDQGDEAAAEKFLAKSRELNRQASELRKITLAQDSLSEEKLAHQLPPPPDDPAARDS